MCELHEDKKYRMPKNRKIIAYKVFDYDDEDNPVNYCGDVNFDFGTVIWDKERAYIDGFGCQTGFQMFAFKKDAYEYACHNDFICEVEVLTKDITNVGGVFLRNDPENATLKAYEAKKFKLFKKNWKKKIQKK